VTSAASAVASASLWVDPVRHCVILVDPGLSLYFAAASLYFGGGIMSYHVESCGITLAPCGILVTSYGTIRHHVASYCNVRHQCDIMWHHKAQVLIEKVACILMMRQKQERESNGFPLIELFHNKVTRPATFPSAHPVGAPGAFQGLL
jgi:hypothetical protein